MNAMKPDDETFYTLVPVIWGVIWCSLCVFAAIWAIISEYGLIGGPSPKIPCEDAVGNVYYATVKGCSVNYTDHHGLELVTLPAGFRCKPFRGPQCIGF